MLGKALVLIGLALFAPEKHTDEATLRDHTECLRISELNGPVHPGQPSAYRSCLLARGWIERPVYRDANDEIK